VKNLVLLTLLIPLAAACTKVSFEDKQILSQKQTADDSAPPVPDFPIPEAEPLRKVGECVDQESVAACLKCDNPLPPPPPAPAETVSTKAQKLAKIMSMACQIPNKSYPNNYVAPSAAQVQAKLLACSPTVYPETSMNPEQSVTMDRLLDENDPSLRLKMFKGLWFQPPYTGHFETYFGLDGSEAAYVICMGIGHLSDELYTTERAYADRSEGGYEQWLRNPEAQARWRAAQKIRQQLNSCLNKPGTVTSAPPSSPTPSAPAQKKCDYKSFEGKFEKGGLEEIQSLLAAGYKVAVEGNQMCSEISQVPSSLDFSGQVKIVGYRCK